MSSVDIPLSDIIKNNEIGRRSSSGNRARGVKKHSSSPPTNSTSRRLHPAVTSNVNRTVRILVSNLASSVVSDDLSELFSQFQPHSVSFNGPPQLGTADVILSKSNAERLVKELTGMALDGNLLEFSLIENIASRIKFPTAPTRNSLKKREKRNGQMRKKMTTEELDAELDAYMTRV